MCTDAIVFCETLMRRRRLEGRPDPLSQNPLSQPLSHTPMVDTCPNVIYLITKSSLINYIWTGVDHWGVGQGFGTESLGQGIPNRKTSLARKKLNTLLACNTCLINILTNLIIKHKNIKYLKKIKLQINLVKKNPV